MKTRKIEILNKAFDEVKNCSMIDPSILKSKVLRLFKENIYQELEKDLLIIVIFVRNVNMGRRE